MKILGLPSINKNLRDEFDAAIRVSDQEKDMEVTGLDTNRAYTPNDLNSDNKTGRSVVADAKFVTELVKMDFSKEETTHDRKVLFQKVINKMARCNKTINDLDVNRFVQIIKDFKVSNFEYIFSRTGYPKKAEHQKVGPKPKVVLKTVFKEGLKTGSVNTKNQSTPVHRGILRPAASTRRKTPLGNFRFWPDVTVKDTLTLTEEITSKVPCPHHSFITVKMPSLEEGGNIVEKFILEHIHMAFEYLWEVDPSMVVYKYPGKIQHSVYVLLYKKKHTRVPQSKKHRKMASTPELKRYTDRVLVHSQMCLYINFFISHSIPITDLVNCDVKYQFENDQMQLIDNEIQAPESILRYGS